MHSLKLTNSNRNARSRLDPFRARSSMIGVDQCRPSSSNRRIRTLPARSLPRAESSTSTANSLDKSSRTVAAPGSSPRFQGRYAVRAEKSNPNSFPTRRTHFPPKIDDRRRIRSSISFNIMSIKHCYLKMLNYRYRLARSLESGIPGKITIFRVSGVSRTGLKPAK